MSGWLRTRVRAALAAAATLTGKRFGLLVASSLVATAAIVAAAATDQPEASPLASLLGHSLAAERTPAPAVTPLEPTAEPEPEAGPAEPVADEASPAPEPVVPGPAPEPIALPTEAAPEAAPEPAPEPEPSEEAEAPEAAPKPRAGRIKHVFLVSLVSSGYEAAFGSGTESQMPYLNGTLRPKGLLLTNYSVLTEALTPNGIATISGQPPNAATEAECPVFTEECLYAVETSTLAEQLEIGGFTWRAYVEGMVSPATGEPANCVYPAGTEEEQVEPGGYSARLNPFTHFHSLLDVGTCAADDVPITELAKDLRSEARTPSFSYISPDLCAAGVASQCPEGAPAGAATADAWLAEVVPEILESPAYKKDGLLIVAFGGVNPPAPPAAGEAPAPPPADPLKTGAVLVSKFITKGSTDAARYSPYSLLRTSEELFGLGLLAEAGGSKVKTLAPALLGDDGAG
ncbi:MAG TPA: alkaline phosphatase family protein [Solirubrobacterales bacterium]|nr:alkaline phosphatase family protein [Solirubrobacterales bacterium]HVY96078.1 alkaline phosphatase family protein [Solirubrobacterales bacterium]